MDAATVPDGKFALVEMAPGDWWAGVRPGGGYTCHFATCPNAGEHRGGGAQ
jgi:hypothetical protein